MSDNVKNFVPKIYQINDPDRIMELWKELVARTYDSEIETIKEFEEIFDPDTAPEVFINLMLDSLGNPFKRVYLTLTQRRKLVKLLIPIYRQKGTGRGIVNAVRFLTGIEIDLIDPHRNADQTWQIGLSEIGFNTYIGGSRVYSNMLDWSEVFANAAWTKTGMTVTSGFITGPSPWYRDADLLDMTAPGATLEQTVTPLVMHNQTFTYSIYLRADAAETLEATLEVDGDSGDSTTEILNVTTSWQRFTFSHVTEPNQANPDLIFRLASTAGLSGNLYAFGAQLVRNNEIQPYTPTEDDGEDVASPGAWIYHFIMSVSEEITEQEEAIIRLVADYMKPAHTHYTLITPDTPEVPGFFQHWEVGVSLVGVNTFVHA